MGKGGQRLIQQKINQLGDVKRKLDHIETEELLKWAKVFAIDSQQEDRKNLLRELEPFADGIMDAQRPAYFPVAPPKFTLKTIRDAIPAHCFKRNLLKSISYLVCDLIVIGILTYLATFINLVETYNLPSWSTYVLWPMYWFAQGTVMTGVWVLAHECGHQSFSESEWANNTFGSILHSFLLVPYHSWRITHGLHHANTGSCDNDEVFVPSTRSDVINEMLDESPLYLAIKMVFMFAFGWMPGYLLFNAAGPSKYRGKNANHFSPSAVFFTPSDYWLIIQSDLAFFIALLFLAYCINKFGLLNVTLFYIVPYLRVNYNLVQLTLLQHTDVFIPHFRNKEFNWLRGALCTVDRSYGGPIMDVFLHHICDTHVCHHLFSKMPFYHAQEATHHIRQVLGPYYLKDNTSIYNALWRSQTCCRFIEDDSDIAFYKNSK